MKNAGVGVGLPDKGRAKLIVNHGVVELYSAASDIGQGCATVFVQIAAQTLGMKREQIRNMGSNSELAPDSGTTSGSRQTLISGEAVRMAAVELKKPWTKRGDLSRPWKGGSSTRNFLNRLTSWVQMFRSPRAMWPMDLPPMW